MKSQRTVSFGLLLGLVGMTLLPLPAAQEGANSANYEFVRIPAGEGVAAFQIGKYDVTVAQFRKFVETTGYKTTAETQGWSFGFTGSDNWTWTQVQGLNWRYGSRVNESAVDNHPVVHVTHADAEAFCKWVGGRLPTSAEWEHAARGGLQGKKYVWGDEWPPPKGAGNFADETAKRKYPQWNIIEGYDDGYADTSPVGAFQPNGYGLYDMVGNVWQRVAEKNQCRGAAFFGRLNPCYLRVDGRFDLGFPSVDVGLRVARTPQNDCGMQKGVFRLLRVPFDHGRRERAEESIGNANRCPGPDESGANIKNPGGGW